MSMTRRWPVALAVVALALAVGSARAAPAPDDRVVVAVYVDPLVADISVNRDSTKVGATIKVRGTVRNDGRRTITDVRLVLHAAGLVASTGEQAVGTLAGGRDRSVTWNVCGATPGSYVLLVEAHAIDDAGRTLGAESRALVVTVLPGRGSCRTG